ncbi:antibiotic biosynthesis monooxygenase [Donghicola tyrosinivorans]|uniref:Antibiotic biosynthesis monooxygenase n=1 Tax=Donghicola tyrosinivorans TaxID=1652492 RepID=A0A2T0WEA2_9RHOB|nr:antibiotic biosynthesis monooxygenase [Donghicola tyrosinivorans]PRY85039.1 antibiotic biosynthesis monooxygenase [Donghicola tyrosinivorans]
MSTPQKTTVEPGHEGPVTLQISRRVVTGREADYEDWLHGVVEAASDFPGHLGVNILRPSGKTDGRYVLIYRFDSFAHCEAW